MNFFDSGGVAIERYSTPFDICKAFYKVRLETYAKRKAHLVKQKKGQVNVLRNKVRFILAVLSEELVVHNRKKAELLAQLVEDGYDAVIPESAKKPKTAANADDDASDDEEAPKQIEEPDDLKTLAKGYDYLLSMRLWALTRERVDALRGELSEKDGELRTLMATATTDLWLTDLQALEEQLDIDDAKREAGEADAAKKAKTHASKKGKKTVSKRAPKKKKTYDSDEESDGYDDDSEDDWGSKQKKKPAPKKAAAPKPKPAAAKPAPAKAPPKAKAAPKAAAKPKPAPKPKKKAKEAWETDEDEESDGFVGSDSDDDNFASSAPVAPRARSGRTAATKKTCAPASDAARSSERSPTQVPIRFGR